MWKYQPPAVCGASAAAGAAGAAGARGATAGATGSYGTGRVTPPVFTRPGPPLSWCVTVETPGRGFGTAVGPELRVSVHTRALAATSSVSAAAIHGMFPCRTVLGAWTSILALMASSSFAVRSFAVRNLAQR